MEASIKLYWETFSELYSTEDIVHKAFNPLRGYEDEFIEGPLLELGCGQSNFAIEYAKTGREIYAVDNEEYQLNKLQERIKEYAPENLEKLRLLNLTLLEDELPEHKFSVVIISNLLHFFTVLECQTVVNQLVHRTKKGSFIFVAVHSDKFYANDPSNPDNNEYFKHYFTEKDIDALFDKKIFEKMFFADIQRTPSKLDKSIAERWIDKSLDMERITDKDERKIYKNAYLKSYQEADLMAIYKRS